MRDENIRSDTNLVANLKVGVGGVMTPKWNYLVCISFNSPKSVIRM